ncbi:MAG: hypothetical protein ABSG61_00565 [Gemmatimonadales bacterium]|jgi:hypothetical protein
MRATTIAVLFPLVFSVPLHAQSRCRLVGVWELVSGKADGQPYPANLHQWKFITRARWAWVAKRDTTVTEMKTASDSLKVANTTEGAGGTYTLQDTTYTEKIEFFPDRAYVGLSVPFACRTEGDRFYQTGGMPILEGGRTVRTLKLEEVWRRIE